MKGLWRRPVTGLWWQAWRQACGRPVGRPAGALWREPLGDLWRVCQTRRPTWPAGSVEWHPYPGRSRQCAGPMRNPRRQVFNTSENRPRRQPSKVLNTGENRPKRCGTPPRRVVSLSHRPVAQARSEAFSQGSLARAPAKPLSRGDNSPTTPLGWITAPRELKTPNTGVLGPRDLKMPIFL